jgi:hypothetical protein
VILSPSRSGEWRNGRRAGFRCQCPSGRGGSSPPSPTISMQKGHNPWVMPLLHPCAGPRGVGGFGLPGLRFGGGCSRSPDAAASGLPALLLQLLQHPSADGVHIASRYGARVVQGRGDPADPPPPAARSDDTTAVFAVRTPLALTGIAGRHAETSSTRGSATETNESTT